MSGLVIGVGNAFRRDDGVGIAVADAVTEVLDARGVPGVRVCRASGEPAELLEMWSGVDCAVVVDAAAGPTASPGRVRRWQPGQRADTAAVSSHALGVAQTYALGQVLDRLPGRLVVLTVDAADTGYGTGLTPTVAAAVPRVVEAVLGELAPGRG